MKNDFLLQESKATTEQYISQTDITTEVAGCTHTGRTERITAEAENAERMLDTCGGAVSTSVCLLRPPTQ